MSYTAYLVALLTAETIAAENAIELELSDDTMAETEDVPAEDVPRVESK